MSSSRAALLLPVALAACEPSFTVVGSDTLVRHSAARRSPEEVFGRVLRVRIDDQELRGELLACDAEGLYLRISTDDGDRWELVRWSEVLRARLRDPGAGGAMLGWTGAGLFSTASHGVFLVITAPIWLLAGSISTGVSASPGEDLGECREAAPFARFPQGLPRSLRARFEGSSQGTTDTTDTTDTTNPTDQPNRAISTSGVPWYTQDSGVSDAAEANAPDSPDSPGSPDSPDSPNAPDSPDSSGGAAGS